MKPFTYLFLIIGVLLLLALPLTPLAAQENARVRIGYFAFDPAEYDTYIDGELASFSTGWLTSGWATSLFLAPVYRADTTTPFMTTKQGTHSFAFVPTGKDVGSAILGPQDVTFEAGHDYVLAILGDVKSTNLSLQVVDQTKLYQGVDLENNYVSILFHNMLGGPPINVAVDGKVAIEKLEYDNWASFVVSKEFASLKATTVEDQPTVLYDLDPSLMEHRISDVSAINGTYPGEPGVDFFSDYNWVYSGDITIDEGSKVAVGDTVAGEISAATHRVAYSLSLDSDMVVDVLALSTGAPSADSIGAATFDPALYIYDEQGNLLFWNDDGTGLSMNKGGEMWSADAALQTVSLKAGAYTIQVGSYADLIAGPYTLIVRQTPGS